MNGTDYLVFVPGIGRVIADPHVRAELLMQDWEQGDRQQIGGTYISTACAAQENQPVGLAFTAALVDATVAGFDSEESYQREAEDAFAAEQEARDEWEAQ